ncbi:MAG TPA: hypothetical protein VGE52_15500, partial [Pirellulales bacterium]
MSSTMTTDQVFDPAYLHEAAQIRDVLDRANYRGKSIVDRVDLRAVMAMHILDQPQLSYNTREKTPLDLLIRLFIGGMKLSRQEATVALEDVDLWLRSGAVREVDGQIERVVEMVPYESYIFPSDPSP